MDWTSYATRMCFPAPMRLHGDTLIEAEGLKRVKRIEKERVRMLKRRKSRAWEGYP